MSIRWAFVGHQTSTCHLWQKKHRRLHN